MTDQQDAEIGAVCHLSTGTVDTALLAPYLTPWSFSLTYGKRVGGEGVRGVGGGGGGQCDKMDESERLVHCCVEAVVVGGTSVLASRLSR